MDAKLPPDARILLVGQAAVFHLNIRSSITPCSIARRSRNLPADKDAPRLPARRCTTCGLTHVYVDWNEIERHRQPGGYGFTDFVTPERFADWVAAGVLDRPVYLGADQELYRIR